jgi:hypothetical protein
MQQGTTTLHYMHASLLIDFNVHVKYPRTTMYVRLYIFELLLLFAWRRILPPVKQYVRTRACMVHI